VRAWTYAGDGVALVGADVEAVLSLFERIALLVGRGHQTLDVLHRTALLPLAPVS
jgi:hypothetical protein